MEEITKIISEKTGISEVQAKDALRVVLELLKDKMPNALGSQLEGLLQGNELNLSDIVKDVSSGEMNNLKDTLTKLF
ncbi:MAG TPA: hypothetical protein VK766_01085 [Cytophagaceae bacterium]|jgi:uncharacterized protein (DUF2267 family)|nr:hypothetical protein [Cytophagaceae bacterium]